MKTIINTVSMILIVAVITGFSWFGLEAYKAYKLAEEFNAMSNTEKIIMYITDREKFNSYDLSDNMAVRILEEIGR